MPVRHASASAGCTCDPIWSIGSACAGVCAGQHLRLMGQTTRDDVSNTHSLRKARAPHGTRCLRCSLAGDRGTRPPGRRRTPWCVLLPFTALRTPPRTLGLSPTACVAQRPTPATRAHALPRFRAFTRDTTPPSPDLVPSFAYTQDATAFAARHLLAYNKLGGYGSHNLGDKARARPARTHTPFALQPPPKPNSCPALPRLSKHGTADPAPPVLLTSCTPPTPGCLPRSSFSWASACRSPATSARAGARPSSHSSRCDECVCF